MNESNRWTGWIAYMLAGSISYPNFHTRVASRNNMKLEARIGAVCYIKEKLPRQ
jgi:hypothetical protein